MMPKRIQLSRRKGYRKPADAVNVARPTKWGNPFNWQEMQPWREDSPYMRRAIAVEWFEDWLKNDKDIDPERCQWILNHLHELRGKDLACWCKLDEPCHADVLLQLVNEEQE